MCSLYSLVFLDARVNTYLPVDLLNLKILSTIKAILLGGVIQKLRGQDEVLRYIGGQVSTIVHVRSVGK